MEIRLILAVLFAFAVCYVNGQVQPTAALTAGNITLTGCNSTKLCMSYNSTCDPSTNSSCFFSSVQVTNQNLTVALSGSTTGFVALAINITNPNQNVTIVFVCGNNSTANTSFFVTALNNGTSLNPTNMFTVSNIQGFSNATQGLVQCIFNVTGNLTINYSNGTNTTYNLTMANSTILSIYNGTTTGTTLGNFNTVYSSNTTVNLMISPPVATNSLNITRAGCNNNSLLCYSNSSICDPSTNTSCFFSSVQYTNQTLMFQLSGPSTGYVALGLILGNQIQNTSYAFVCGLNTTSNSSFFQTAVINGTNLNATNSFNVSGYQSTVNVSQNVVQCVFNITNPTIINGMLVSPNPTNLIINSTTLTIMNGTTNGTQLGPFSTQFSQTFILPSPPLNITRAGCNNSTMLCFSNSSTCDPSTNTSCFFSSVQYTNQTVMFQLSGSSTGYVALGVILSNQTQNISYAFVCGLNTTSNSSFFQTAVINGTNLNATNSFNVSGYQSTVNVSQNLVQCVFNITFNSLIIGMFGSLNPTNLIINSTTVTIMNGTTSNGTQLGPFSIQFSQTFSLPSPTPPSLLINRTNCNNTKLCISSGNSCDPSVNSSCFFSSIQSNNSSYYFELCGPSTGYVALGLANTASSTMFICGNRSNSFFFQPYLYNSTSTTNLSPANVTSVYSSQGVMNGGVISCVFNISNNFTITAATRASNSYNLSIASGAVNGTSLGNPVTKIATNGAVNIGNATANFTITDYTGSGANSLTHWTQVMAVLLAAMTLHFL